MQLFILHTKCTYVLNMHLQFSQILRYCKRNDGMGTEHA